VDAAQARVDDDGELDAHAVRVLEPQGVERTEILDRAIGRTAVGMAPPTGASPSNPIRRFAQSKTAVNRSWRVGKWRFPGAQRGRA
jgi:hypothetical protein